MAPESDGSFFFVDTKTLCMMTDKRGKKYADMVETVVFCMIQNILDIHALFPLVGGSRCR